MYVVYINCVLFPFVKWIIKGLKTFETRNRNTLKRLVGMTVYLAETGIHKKPVIRCICTIGSPVIITDKQTYNKYRKQTKVKKGSVFDFTNNTKRKVLYPVYNVIPVKPFVLPDNVIRHNRSFCQIIGK